MEYAVQNLEESQSRCLSGIADSEKRKAELEAKIGQPFEHEEKLQSLTVRQQEIVKALDITKSQAASSQDSANSEDEGQSVSPAIENRQTIEKPTMRRAVAVGV
jgi:DNA-directed RNA polymerase specialized sigma subunit